MLIFLFAYIAYRHIKAQENSFIERLKEYNTQNRKTLRQLTQENQEFEQNNPELFPGLRKESV